MRRILALLGLAVCSLIALIATSGNTVRDPFEEPIGDWPHDPRQNGRAA